MATYYVSSSTGSNTNNGLSPSSPWLTLAFALGAALGTNPGVVGGDIIYIAPGNYNENVVIGFSTPSSVVQILGDPLNIQGFPSVVPNIVNWFSTGSSPLTATSKNSITIKNIYFENFSNYYSVDAINCYSWSYEKCVFASRISHTVAQSVSLGLTVNKCIFGIGNIDKGIVITGASGANYNINTVINDCISVAIMGFLKLDGNIGGVTVYNCTAFATDQVIRNNSANTTDKLIIKNTFMSSGNNNVIFSTSTNTTTLDFCHRIGNIINATETNQVTTPKQGIDYGYSRLTGFGINDFFAPYASSVNAGSGTPTGAPATDIYGVTWFSNPDIGAPQRSSTLNFQQQANSVERNASAITIAPASTSQSIELYLGATGLTFATSGLAAYYVRNREAPTPITLVTQTPTGAWSSGGFAEISSSLVPGVYRLDVPNAAFAAGASDVTIVVRGASGTNGAVLTVTLSSGGLTAAQTAAAVWDEATASHTTHGTYGWNTLRADAQSKQGLVTLHSSGGINRVDADVHAIVNDTAAATYLKGALLHDGTGYVDADAVRISTSTAAANELEGALLHNGTDYISADLLTPVSAATSVHIGPYQLLADGLGADQPLDVNVGTATSIDVQVTDANGTGIDITGATVTAKVYSSAGTLVASYAGTATYADNGRLTFGLTTTVTNTSGTYTVTVTRTTGATDTQIFGPLRLYVRPV